MNEMIEMTTFYMEKKKFTIQTMIFNRHWRLRGAVPLSLEKTKPVNPLDCVRKNKMKQDKKYIYIYGTF